MNRWRRIYRRVSMVYRRRRHGMRYRISLWRVRKIPWSSRVVHHVLAAIWRAAVRWHWMRCVMSLRKVARRTSGGRLLIGWKRIRCIWAAEWYKLTCRNDVRLRKRTITLIRVARGIIVIWDPGYRCPMRIWTAMMRRRAADGARGIARPFLVGVHTFGGQQRLLPMCSTQRMGNLGVRCFAPR